VCYWHVNTAGPPIGPSKWCTSHPKHSLGPTLGFSAPPWPRDWLKQPSQPPGTLTKPCRLVEKRLLVAVHSFVHRSLLRSCGVRLLNWIQGLSPDMGSDGWQHTGFCVLLSGWLGTLRSGCSVLFGCYPSIRLVTSKDMPVYSRPNSKIKCPFEAVFTGGKKKVDI